MNSSTQWTIARPSGVISPPADDVAGWWWGEFQPTERWLRTGADLGGPRRHRRGHLRTGVTLEHATDILWTFSSPELYELLVLRSSWDLPR
jgi:hypothetical protein